MRDPCLLHVCSDVPVPRGISRPRTVFRLGRLPVSRQRASANVLVKYSNRTPEPRTLNPRVRGSSPWRRTRRSSSLKERAGVKGGFGLQFCGGMAFAGHGGMALWLAFPDRCRVRVSGLAGQGPGGARPRSGAGGVLDALVREPIMAGAGKGRGRVYGLCGYGRPIAGCPAGRPAGCLHPFGCAPAWRAGGHGAGSRPGTGGANHISVPAGPAGAGCGGEHKTSRPRARPGRQLTLPG